MSEGGEPKKLVMDDDYDLDYEMEDNDGRWAHASAPSSLNVLRACIPCLLVKTFRQFMDEGCENCAKAFDMKEDEAKIADCTTASFEGLMALTQPKASWVARWQFVHKFMPGVYAIKVNGEVSAATEQELEDVQLPNIGKMLQQEVLKKPQGV